MPALGSLHKVDLRTVEPTLAKQSIGQLTSKEREGDFGRPDTLRFILDGKPIKIVIAPGMLDGDRWIARANASHLLYVSDAKNGNAGDMLIYTRQSWRTVAHPDQIRQGTNLFVETNTGWRYMFRVQEVQHASSAGQTVIPAARDTQLVFVVNESSGGASYIVRSQFVSLHRVGSL